MNKFAIVATLAAGLAAQTAAYAGYSYPSTVGVYNASGGGGTASGAVRPARYSSDSTQYITCGIASDAVSSAYVSCSARDSAGASLYCYTSTPSTVALNALSSVNDTSFIYFQVNSAGNCTYLSISNGSNNL
jgi:hypothetical protein